MPTITRSTVLDAAHAALGRAVHDLDPHLLSLPTPGTEWTVAQVVEHAVIDQGIRASAVAAVEPPGGDAFAPAGNP
jgi:hypothetical protein